MKKKLGLVMAVLMVATPLWASVDITCSAPPDSFDVTVSYKVVGEVNSVRGFALDIMVDQGAKIKEVYMNSLDPNYWVYPGSIVINTTTNPPTVSDKGTPVANPYDPCLPGQTLPGLDSNGITIEMGSLYWPTGDNSPNAPKLSGKLLKFRVDKKPTCVTIRENAIRGGVVLTNPNLNPTVNAPQYCMTGEVPCLPNTVSYYSTWLAQGKPECWCYPRQCYGDADGKLETTKTGTYYVHFNDLNILLANWNVKGTTMSVPGICADFKHDYETTKTGTYRVHFNDLNMLLANWNVKGTNIPADCGGTAVPP